MMLQSACMAANHRPLRGFTFLELLLAMAISGIILGASGQLMFSFAHFWKQSELEPRYAHHVDGVVSFLQYCFDQSENLSGNQVRRFSWEVPPEETKPTIHFRLETAPPFFVTEIRPSPQVDAWVVFDEDQGLSLLWHIPAELTEGKIELLRTPISPWVEDVEVGYLDSVANVWKYESYADDSKSKTRPAPQALRILFNQNGRAQTRHIRMHRHDRHVLIY
ncbi:MAG: prepilin-type N-terminal cleavage/methylation domain-containing protein [Verrucomicrobiota bacterium]|nr:prepilin-type N-terminal cleavage/methylation domain-containing protein [Verrucomicrobiota bacterium]